MPNRTMALGKGDTPDRTCLEQKLDYLFSYTIV